MTQTATNPETGERVALIGGKWEPFEKSATNDKGEKAFLVRGQWVTDRPQEAQLSAPGAIAKGTNVGLAQGFGAPIDLLNAGLGTVGLGSREPFGGSEQIRRLMGNLAYRSIEEVPQDLRPLARGGEAFGASMPFAAVPLAAARAGAKVPQALAPMITAARESPRAFAATEVGGAFGAAQGAAAAELLAPGQDLVRTGAEIAGGFVNPVGALSRASGAIGGGAKNLISGFTASGRQAKAADAIQKAMIEAGESPENVARLLKGADLGGVSLTAGQKAESPVLMALEATLASKHPDFDAAMRLRTTENLSSLRKLIGQLEASGDPTLLREAARQRSRYFDGLISGRLQAAQAQADRAAKAVGGDAAVASTKASAVLDDALSDARAAERALWEQVPRDVPLKAENTIAAYKNITEGGYKERPMPPGFVDAFVARISKAPKETGPKLILPEGVAPTSKTPVLPDVSSGELLAFRSDMLARARQARAQKDWVNSRIYEDMADGALADISAMEGNAAQKARDFSRSLNDAFSRTFASDALAVNAQGGDRIVPEAVLQRAFGSGGTISNRRFQDLEAAAQFSGKSMLHEQEDFLRTAAQASVDPQTGRVNPRSLEGFLRANSPMLERFPSLKRELADASKAEQAFRSVQVQSAASQRALAERAAFSEVLANESPANALRNILNSQNPQNGYNQLIKLSRRGGDDAVAGLRATTLEYAARQATDQSGVFSFPRFKQALERPMSGTGSSSLIDYMATRGVMSPADASRMRFIVSNAERIEQSLASKAHLGDLVAQPDALFDLVVRATGANIGGASVFAQSSGAPIVMAGAGSRVARNLFEKLPMTRVVEVMKEAAMNPKFMAALLEKPASPVRAAALERQINGFMLQAGLIPEDERKRVPD